ncbi:putative signal peptide-containing protein [Cryptosporidium canis]|uniref:Signal peptide-containing protein n=1 Tax=Cryptosporidium canis TaxID=195482 RepID=A0A9D5DEV2_9CRYT|nr:putative signal peptide-containing protein [Cryptosporidium canis]
MSRGKGAGGGSIGFLIYLSWVLVIQLSWWVSCSEVSGTDGLSFEDKRSLFEVLNKKRYMFLERFLLEGEAPEDLGELVECRAERLYSKMTDLMLGESSPDLELERKVALGCLRPGIQEALSHYEQFLSSKFADRHSCLDRLCLKRPEKPYFKELESLSALVNYLLVLDDFAKESGDITKELVPPEELQSRNEAISVIGEYKQFDSPKEALRVCMKFNMMKILAYPKYNKTELLSEHKIFCSVIRLLKASIGKNASKYKKYRANFQASEEKKCEKSAKSVQRKIQSLIKLLSYTVLTRLLILADITNTEEYKQIYKTMVNNSNQI